MHARECFGSGADTLGEKCVSYVTGTQAANMMPYSIRHIIMDSAQSTRTFACMTVYMFEWAHLFTHW